MSGYARPTERRPDEEGRLAIAALVNDARSVYPQGSTRFREKSEGLKGAYHQGDRIVKVRQ
jgi:hypothetical protein